MKRFMLIKSVLLFSFSLTMIQAFADSGGDQVEQQKMLKFALASLPECKDLPIAVPQSIILNDGDVIGDTSTLPHNVDLHAQIRDCVSGVGRAIELQGQRDNANPVLITSLRAAVMKFLVFISVSVGPKKAPIVPAQALGQMRVSS